MEASGGSLSNGPNGGSNIPFPFEHPYPQQVDLMKAIISTILKGNIGLFESPTGTGKSMSVICSVLHWLQAEERKIICDVKENSQPSTSRPTPASTSAVTATASTTGIDWLDDFITSNSEEQEMNKRREEAVKVREVLLQRIRRKASIKPLPLTCDRKAFPPKGLTASMQQAGEGKSDNLECGQDCEDLLCHYDSDGGDNKLEVGYDSGSDLESSSSFRKASDIPIDDKKNVNLQPLEEEVQSQLQMPQIIYCSRTHSQLAQFISEVKKATAGRKPALRCITLGSRSNMCINPTVRGLASDAAISEKCLDMQRPRAKAATSTGRNNSVSGESDKKRQRVLKSVDKQEKDEHKCEFHSSIDEQHFSEHALGAVSDIEDLVLLGKTLQACPYYSARRALAQAQVVCLPYNLIVSKQSRQALGISLKGNVVIFDEAHNMVEAVNMVHSAGLSHAQLTMTLLALQAYLARFRNILSGKNFYYITLLISIAKSFLKLMAGIAKQTFSDNVKGDAKGDAQMPNCCGDKRGAAMPFSAVYTVNDFVFKSRIDNVNLRKVERYIEVTHLVRKVGGHVDGAIKKQKEILIEASLLASAKQGHTSKKKVKHLPDSTNSAKKSDEWRQQRHHSALDPRVLAMTSSATHSLRTFFGLLTALQNSDTDGRIFVAPPRSSPQKQQQQQESQGIGELSIQYVLMNPSNHFADIVTESRSVLFLGGTLRPFDYILSSLLPRCTLSQSSNRNGDNSSSSSSNRNGAEQANANAPKVVDTFSCSHIIPSSHISTYAVPSGPSNVLLDFRHGVRDRDQLVRELFWSVHHICQEVPHGVVLFFTSYAYMELVVAAWKKALLTPHLAAIKHICVEQRQRRATSDTGRGGRECHTDSGVDAWEKYRRYIQQSCAGSERGKGAVLLSVMGGKLSEGINFSDNLARAVVIVGMPYPDLSDPVLKEKLNFAERAEKNSSRRIYEGMCMKSVNQSIGRSIRHIGDYATVLLLDNRYTQPRVSTQLPGWILKSTSGAGNGIFHTIPKFEDTIASLKRFFALKESA